MDIEYALLREKNRQLKYRLWRRSFEVIRAIQEFAEFPQNILDLGTAEGRMMQTVKSHFPQTFCIGIDASLPLLNYGKKQADSSNVLLIQADIQDLSFLRSSTFEIIIAAAVIEHLDFPNHFLLESFRVLKKDGLMIITTPHPLWEKMASCLHLIKGEHKSVMSIQKLKSMSISVGFNIMEEKGFMISPTGFPGEAFIEGFIHYIRADRYLPNQLIILKKCISV